MNDDACREHRREVEAALKERERVLAQSSGAPEDETGGATSPIMGGDLGSRFYEVIGREEAAKRRYRTAVRALAECLRAHRTAGGEG